jgi:glycosyltransferase involved in cell wall biosynthesis
MVIEGLVSVIMPCFRAASTLERSVFGVLSQTYTNWELWLMVDGADDGTAELAKSLSNGDARIRVVISQKNRGVSRSRNLGMRLSGGPWIAFCDADDRWLPNKLALQMNAILRSGANVCCSSFSFYYPETGTLMPVQTRKHIDYQVLLQTNPIPLSTAVFDRRLQRGVYFPEMPATYVHEDYAFWLYLFQRSTVKAVYLTEVTTEITHVVGSRSSNKWLAMKSHGYILRTVAEISGLQWCGLMLSYVWHGSMKRVLGKRIHQG